MPINRRGFLRGAAAVGIGFSGLGAYYAFAEDEKRFRSQIKGYGPLVKDPAGIVDLPEGFFYKILSRAGEMMDDKLPLPGKPDGMAAFAGSSGKVIVVRNHENYENDSAKSPFGKDDEYLDKIPADKIFDIGVPGVRGMGGTSTFVYDLQTGKIEKQFLSLAGTIGNCCGGPTPWGSWLSCEETEAKAGGGLKKDHGYVFEVPATEDIMLANPKPIIEMGRFYREAAAVDPKSGTVYLTEDKANGLFYRFLPTTPGNLQGGGKLQALAIKEKSSADMTNWANKTATIGTSHYVTWIDLAEVDNPNNDLRERGFRNGAAIFARGEGMWFGDKELYFTASTGGAKRLGQIWKYTPSEFEGSQGENTSPGQIELFAEPENDQLLERCDNLTIAPWGHLMVCEDGSGEDYIRGINSQGQIYTFAKNAISFSEWAGVCFSPDGSTMFANIQAEGLTVAIRGPWQNIAD